MIFLFTESNFPLYDSLKRYFHFIIESELKLSDAIFSPINTNATVFILEEEKEKRPFLEYLVKNKTVNVLISGLNDNCQINLLRFHDLRQQIEASLRQDRSKARPVFTKDELMKKVSGLFKSHGRESIFQLLNSVEYSLINYKIYEQDVMDWAEYKAQIITPAIAGWEQFKQRFDQYWPYFSLLDFDCEVELIIRNIKAFDPIWSEFISFKTNPGPDMNTKIINAFQLEKKINDILTEISIKLGITEIH